MTCGGASQLCLRMGGAFKIIVICTRPFQPSVWFRVFLGKQPGTSKKRYPCCCMHYVFWSLFCAHVWAGNLHHVANVRKCDWVLLLFCFVFVCLPVCFVWHCARLRVVWSRRCHGQSAGIGSWAGPSLQRRLCSTNEKGIRLCLLGWNGKGLCGAFKQHVCTQADWWKITSLPASTMVFPIFALMAWQRLSRIIQAWNN